jgi:putative membrane protein
MLGTLLGILLALVAAAVVIYIVGRLNLGMTVEGFAPAIVAAAAIAIIGGVIYWLLGVLGITIGGGWLGAIINLLIAAAVILLAGRWVKGLKVNGYVGAIIAAIGIGVVTGVINWLLGLLGLA